MNNDENKIEEITEEANAEQGIEAVEAEAQNAKTDKAANGEEHHHHHHHHNQQHINPFVNMRAEEYNNQKAKHKSNSARRPNQRGNMNPNPRANMNPNPRGNMNPNMRTNMNPNACPNMNPNPHYNPQGHPKGNLDVKLDSSTAFSEVANSEEMAIQYRHKAIARMAVVMSVLTVISVLLRIFTFNTPYIPQVLNYDFSALPEVIVSIAYGPVFGLIVVLIKNIIYVILKIKTLSVPSIITNVVLNSIYVFITGAFYSRKMFPFNPDYRQPERDLRRLHILGGGTAASAVAAVASFFLAKYVTLPIMFKLYSGYTEEYIVYLYQQALDTLNGMLPAKLSGVVTEIGTLTRGIAIYNIPHTFFKFFVITLLAMIIYNFISPFLHYRIKKKDEEGYRLQKNEN